MGQASRVDDEQTVVATAAPVTPSLPIDAGDHQATAIWLAEHPEALHGYADAWVAVVGHDVVGHGSTMTDAFLAAKSRGHDDPLLVPVLPPDVILIP